MKKVGVIMGSDSDLPVVEKAMDKLKEYGVLKMVRAGEGGRNHGKRHHTGDESRSNFLLQRHNSIDPSLVDCRHFVGSFGRLVQRQSKSSGL